MLLSRSVKTPSHPRTCGVRRFVEQMTSYGRHELGCDWSARGHLHTIACDWSDGGHLAAGAKILYRAHRTDDGLNGRRRIRESNSVVCAIVVFCVGLDEVLALDLVSLPRALVMIMDDLKNGLAEAPASSFADERVEISFDSFKFNNVGGLPEGEDPVAPAKDGIRFDETLNTPRTATTDGHFSFVRSQLEMTQEAPPIIGEFSR